MAKSNRGNGRQDFSEKEESSRPMITPDPKIQDLVVSRGDRIMIHTNLTIGEGEATPSSSENTNSTPKKSRRKEPPIAITMLDPTEVGLALWRARLLFVTFIDQLALLLTDKITAAQLKKAAQDEKCQLLSTIEKWEPIKRIQGVLDRIPVPPDADINPKTGLDQEDEGDE